MSSHLYLWQFIATNSTAFSLSVSLPGSLYLSLSSIFISPIFSTCSHLSFTPPLSPSTPLFSISLLLYFSFLCQPHSSFHHLTLCFILSMPSLCLIESFCPYPLFYWANKNKSILLIVSFLLLSFTVVNSKQMPYMSIMFMSKILCFHSPGSYQTVR